ncbi:MauE/DoxX family redox-associated membrane protein [Actinomadura macra]|uniref:MauE/DoxX family redox-associated membrane protein n=1 Tax=Actinomadura macra TaxID=46164 RepID=UPI00083788E6|nr:MauE/DoxX family redox-associated membrane protein [Actinomadura macra]
MEFYFLLGARCLLITVFTVAVFTKRRSAARFAHFCTTVRNLTMFSERAAVRAAAFVLGCETAVAVLLLLPIHRIGFVLAAGLLSLFIAVVFRAVRGGVFAECGCFGGRSALLSYPLIVRNVLLLAFAVPGALLAPAGPPSLDPLPTGLALITGFLAAWTLIRYYDVLVGKLLRRLHPARPGTAVTTANTVGR